MRELDLLITRSADPSEWTAMPADIRAMLERPTDGDAA